MQELFKLFEEMGKPYFRQGSMSDRDYAPEFFTFWNVDTPNLQIRDNKVKSFVEFVQIGYYTNNANLIYSRMDEFIQKAKEKGFVIASNPQDANADKESYFGRVCFIRIIHRTED